MYLKTLEIYGIKKTKLVLKNITLKNKELKLMKNDWNGETQRKIMLLVKKCEKIIFGRFIENNKITIIN